MEDPTVTTEQGGDDVAGYQAPRVETVLTTDDVERESLYGGISQG